MGSPVLDEIHLNDTPTSPSPEMFSFPGTPTDDHSEFEFGSCVTPDSPTMTSCDVANSSNSLDDFSTTSPADQFFLNGRLLPHDFPVVHAAASSNRASFSGRENMGPAAVVTLSRGTSAGSNKSVSSQHSSKDYSLVSSRSNSINSSRGSTCNTCASSSARSSSSEVNTERKAFQKRMHSLREKNVSGGSPLGQYYKFGTSGSSQRWQFITAVPVLGPSQSRGGTRRENGGLGGTGMSPRTMMSNVASKGKRGGDNNSNASFLYKILRSVVATCKACHAMEGQEKEFELDGTNDVLGH